jgi:thioredoxin 2
MSSIIIPCSGCRTDNPTPALQLLSRPRCLRCQQALTATAPIEVTREVIDGVLRDSPIPVLLLFYSQWNAPSSMVAPVLAEVAKRHAGRLLVLRINTDMSPDVMKRYTATPLPALLVFRSGSERQRLHGAHSTVELEKLLSDSGAVR